MRLPTRLSSAAAPCLSAGVARRFAHRKSRHQMWEWLGTVVDTIKVSSNESAFSRANHGCGTLTAFGVSVLITPVTLRSNSITLPNIKCDLPSYMPRKRNVFIFALECGHTAHSRGRPWLPHSEVSQTVPELVSF
jgi:hypothetical protein